MPPQLLFILGVIIVVIVICGLFSGKIIAGSRGLAPNYYSRKDNPLLYYIFLVTYALIATFIFCVLI